MSNAVFIRAEELAQELEISKAKAYEETAAIQLCRRLFPCHTLERKR